MFQQILLPTLLIGGLGLILGLALAFAAKAFHVERDPRQDQIMEALPAANCGACGYAGCQEYAAAVTEGRAAANLCTVGGSPVSARIAQIMGQEHKKMARRAGVVKCQGKAHLTTVKYDYQGIPTCAAQSLLVGGHKQCSYGCLGFGDCAKVCNFGAISLIDGIAVIDRDKCTACGVCVKSCPKNLIELTPIGNEYCVLCSSHDKGAVARKFCQVACIACGICKKQCPEGAIEIENNLARIVPDRCQGNGVCYEKCPTKAICKI